MKNAEEPGWNEHGPLLGLAVIWLLAIAGYAINTDPRRHLPPAQPPAAITTQAYYEREKAGLHGMEHSDLETTAEKLDRIRRRDEAARNHQPSTLNHQPSTSP